MSDITKNFLAFHAENPRVYTRLVELGRELVRRGYKRLGIRMLCETLRYEYRRTNDPSSEIKLNNAEDWREQPTTPANVRPQRWAERADVDRRRQQDAA